MSWKVTKEALEAYLNCKFKGHLMLAGEQGAPTDYAVMQVEARHAARACVIQGVCNRHRPDQVVCGLRLTAAALRTFPLFIFDATFEDEVFSITIDGLKRVEGASDLGAFHYVPMLFHEGPKVGTVQRLELEIAARCLATMQGRPPARGIVWCGTDGKPRKILLNGAARKIDRLVRDIKETLASGTVPRMTLNYHCQICEFRSRCRAEAISKDDLSLFGNIGEQGIAKYARRGIFTISQLSYTFRGRRKSGTPAGPRQRQHALQALAVRERKVYILGSPELPDAETRVYFDIEGDPERQFDYLLGMIVESNGVVERHSFWVDDPNDEQRLLEQFVAAIGSCDNIVCFSYGSYEAAFLRRMIKASGRADLSEKLLSRVVNVLSIIHAHVYFPTYSNGLKEISKFLGCHWTEPDASGLQSIVWRRKWETTRCLQLKERLTAYNLEDCEALRAVTAFLFTIRRGQLPVRDPSFNSPIEIKKAEDVNSPTTRPSWGTTVFANSDFSFVNERAYFDYQRDKVFVRTSKLLQQIARRNGTKRWKKNRKVNQEVEVRSRTCSHCGATALRRRKNASLARLAFDLRIMRGGIKGWVIRYRTAWHRCTACKTRFLPDEYLRSQEFCHSLKSWAMYQHVAHRVSMPSIAAIIRESFNMPMDGSQVHGFKKLLADYYRPTYEQLLKQLIGGDLLHVDETEIRVQRIGKVYVWVFANMEVVVYMYRPSRACDFLHELLGEFHGVLVTDFYAGYDSLECPQQKCLIHLVRDFNQDMIRNPWDEELKNIASQFGLLLRKSVSTIDKYGLRCRNLAKHRRDADRFFETIERTVPRSEVAEGYRSRLLKYRDKLFTFLSYDSIPWNNNNAEHAIKSFAQYREVADNLLNENGLTNYLVLLSINQTCRYKGVSFLKFLLSRELDVDAFAAWRKTISDPTIEVYPAGAVSARTTRKRILETPPRTDNNTRDRDRK